MIEKKNGETKNKSLEILENTCKNSFHIITTWKILQWNLGIYIYIYIITSRAYKKNIFRVLHTPNN